MTYMDKSTFITREGVLNRQLCITAITVMLNVKRCQVKEDAGITPPFLLGKDVVIEAVWDGSDEGASPIGHFSTVVFTC